MDSSQPTSSQIPPPLNIEMERKDEETKEFPPIKFSHPKNIELMVNTMRAKKHFVAKPSDVFITSFPKSGTTWTMAILIATLNRDSSTNPLANLSPHDAVPNLESEIFTSDELPDLSNIPSPRLFSSHVPYEYLPMSILHSQCKIIYVWRDPKDVVVSLFHFLNKVNDKLNIPSVSLGQLVDLFCDEHIASGSLWKHILGFWKASLENKSILFLRYEDMKMDLKVPLKKLGEFVGKPYSVEEENNGVLDHIIQLCSIESLKSMEVNLTGHAKNGYENKAYFRKGNVGDWINHLTPDMKGRIDRITQEKFAGSGLPF